MVRTSVCAVLPIAFFCFCAQKADAFGATLIVPTGAQLCQPYLAIASQTIAVSATSRLFATATVTASPSAVIWITITDSGGTVLGVTIDATATAGSNFTVQGVLHQGATPLDASAAALALPPGTYTLETRLKDVLCGQNNPYEHYGSVVLI